MRIDELSVGDWIELKTPERGYRNAEVIGFEDTRVVIRLTSGYKFRVYADEIAGFL